MSAEFRLLLDPPADGAWNMAVDETLLEAAAAEGRCTLRFYQWAEPTLSLGYFQAYADRDKHEASRGCALVRRTSGGGAIMHDFDLTYSLAVPDGHPLAANRLRTYRVFHDALIGALADRGIEASLFASSSAELLGSNDSGRRPSGSPSPGHRPGIVETPPMLSAQRANSSGSSWPVGPTSVQDDSGSPGRCPGLGELGSFGAAKEPFLCFQRRAPGDVLVKGEKVAGSAQRRCRGAVLQHGSVLLARSPAAPELDGLKELVGQTIPVEEFIQAWLHKLSDALAIRWQRGCLSETRRRQAARLVAEKYGAAAWTNAR
jgi:lipoate-protein ligase A